MADQPMLPLHLRSDEDLGIALQAMAGEIDWPRAVPGDGAPDVATLVAVRLAGTPPPRQRPYVGVTRPRWTWRPATRALVVALIVLLALAALAGAAGLGLPGLRIIFGTPEASPSATAAPSASTGGAVVLPTGSAALASPSPTPVPGPPGAGLGLGAPVDPSTVDGLAGYRVIRRPETTLGAPDAAWIDVSPQRPGRAGLGGIGPVAADERARGRADRDGLPGQIDQGWFKKILGAGTKVEAVEVNGNRGYWITGDPHLFFYQGPDGAVDEPRRWVGDALLWSDGPITHRLETSLGRDAAIALAESMR